MLTTAQWEKFVARITTKEAFPGWAISNEICEGTNLLLNLPCETATQFERIFHFHEK